jgi:hypothetical protein
MPGIGLADSPPLRSEKTMMQKQKVYAKPPKTIFLAQMVIILFGNQ